MAKTAPKKAPKKTIKRSAVTGRFTLVRDISKDYGISFEGNQSERLSTYLKKNGKKSLGNAMEVFERELGKA